MLLFTSTWWSISLVADYYQTPPEIKNEWRHIFIARVNSDWFRMSHDHELSHTYTSDVQIVYFFSKSDLFIRTMHEQNGPNTFIFGYALNIIYLLHTVTHWVLPIVMICGGTCMHACNDFTSVCVCDLLNWFILSVWSNCEIVR